MSVMRWRILYERDQGPAAYTPRTRDHLIDWPKDCGQFFRFRHRDHIRRLLYLLDFPDRCDVGERHVLQGETCFIFFLRRMTEPGHMDDLVNFEFGGERTTWGRAFKFTAKWLYRNWGYKLLDNLDFFVPRFRMYAAKIEAYVNKILVNKGAQPFPAGSCRVFGFLDDNNVKTCRPGGPAQAGRGAPRVDNLIQEAFFNGWLRACGIKHETLDGPDGLTLFIWGPASLRRSDLWTLSESDIDAKLGQVQTPVYGPLANHFVMYGDSIFPNDDHLRCRHSPPVGHPQYLQLSSEDEAMNSAREAIEHHYGHGDILFQCMNYSKKLKIRAGMPLKEIYFCKQFLRNCYTCLYQNLTSERFECEPPTLEEYLA
jgi:hypothetical protein